MAWLLWPVCPGPTAQSWEGVPGLRPAGQQPTRGPMQPPTLPAPSSRCCSWPGRARTELTVLSPEVWLLQVDASSLHVHSEGQPWRARAWPPCSEDLLCAGG